MIWLVLAALSRVFVSSSGISFIPQLLICRLTGTRNWIKQKTGLPCGNPAVISDWETGLLAVVHFGQSFVVIVAPFRIFLCSFE